MKYFFITNIEPLKLLLDFDTDKFNIDIHNDFECFNIISNENIEFYFKRIVGNEHYKEQNAALVFSNVIESNIDMLLRDGTIGDIDTINNFARGLLSEKSPYYSDKNVRYFFVGFMNGELIDIFCREAIIILW